MMFFLLSGKIQSRPVLNKDESMLYFGSGEGDTYVHGVSTADGGEVWRYAADGGTYGA